MATVTGTSGNDYIYNSLDPLTPAVPPPGFNPISGVTFGADTIDGSAGNDIIYGSGGADAITGGDGDDLLVGGPGADALTGGNGNDTASYATSQAGGVFVSLTLGQGFFSDANGDTLTTIENLVGSPFGDILTGDGNDNVIQGGGGPDTLSGLAGNDTLEGGEGADTIDGGTGINTASYASSSAAVNVTVGGAATGGDATGDILTNIQNLTGSSFNDTLTGDANANVLQGGAGDDTLTGGDGNDTLEGGTGNDTINGGAGDDLSIWRNGDGTDTVDGGIGIDKEQLFMSTDVTTGDITTLTASGATAVFERTNLIGFKVNTTNVETFEVNGLAGDDSLTVGNLAGTVVTGVTFNGGDGNDTLDASATAVVITADGGAGNDTLTGGSANDTLNGGAGNDTLQGGAGNDAIDGGTGTDTASYASSALGVTVDLTIATAQVSTGDASGDTIKNIENLTGSAFDDTLTGDASDNLLNGGSGNDTLNGGAGNDTLNGGDDNDTLVGGTGNDTINGGAGNDTSIWRNGDGTDTVDGGAGTNTEQVFLSTGTTGDIATLTASGSTAVFERTNLVGFKINTTNIQQFQVSGLAGDDQFTVGALTGTNITGVTFFGGDGNDLLVATQSNTPITAGGDVGDDTLYGGLGNDDLIGGIGNDTLIGGAGNDILDGSDGNDFLYGSDGNDGLWGGAGNDSVQGEAGNDVLVLQDGDDAGYGGDGNDYIYAGNGNDSLYGGTGSDVLLGEAGNDFLAGGGAGVGGVDYLFGGAGTDVFVVENFAGATVISDFNRTDGDVINLHGVSGFTSFANVTSNATDVSSGVIVTVNSGQNIWILGQTTAALQASDFSFA